LPELPDVTVYLEALAPRIAGARLERVRLLTPFLLRSVDPPLSAAAGRHVTGLRRIGKRIVIALEEDLFLVIHLMIAGRLHWRAAGARPPGKIGLAAFDFSTGTLLMTEAGTKKRASLDLVRGTRSSAC
jgi:formamidopyrimidine-DNA glycosylase